MITQGCLGSDGIKSVNKICIKVNCRQQLKPVHVIALMFTYWQNHCHLFLRVSKLCLRGGRFSSHSAFHILSAFIQGYNRNICFSDGNNGFTERIDNAFFSRISSDNSSQYCIHTASYVNACILTLYLTLFSFSSVCYRKLKHKTKESLFGVNNFDTSVCKVLIESYQ